MCMPRVLAADFLRVPMTDLLANISMRRMCERFIDGVLLVLLNTCLTPSPSCILTCDPSY